MQLHWNCWFNLDIFPDALPLSWPSGKQGSNKAHQLLQPVLSKVFALWRLYISNLGRGYLRRHRWAIQSSWNNRWGYLLNEAFKYEIQNMPISLDFHRRIRVWISVSLSLIMQLQLRKMATIPRVDSTASELNDFQETKEGKKIYNVSMSMTRLFWYCYS